MHDDKRYKATFRDLIITAFGKQQVLKLRIEITMYQQSDCPARWSFTPTLPTGQPHPHAPSPVDLARMIEGMFVARETDWRVNNTSVSAPLPKPAVNVVPIDQKRRAAR